jgi:hypothetical protein
MFLITLNVAKLKYGGFYKENIEKLQYYVVLHKQPVEIV